MGSSERLKPEINLDAIQEFRSHLREKMFCATKKTGNILISGTVRRVNIFIFAMGKHSVFHFLSTCL
jgi:hypothetical protein